VTARFVLTALEDGLSKQRGETGSLHIREIEEGMRGNISLWRREYVEIHMGACEVRDLEMIRKN
jgi:hypothetical protein